MTRLSRMIDGGMRFTHPRAVSRIILLINCVKAMLTTGIQTNLLLVGL